MTNVKNYYGKAFLDYVMETKIVIIGEKNLDSWLEILASIL